MDNQDTEQQPKSKSQIKRELSDLQRLGAELVQLNASQLAAIPLPASVLDAVQEAQKIKSHSAGKRQRQYIGKLLRDIDPGPIRESLASLRQQSDTANAVLHQTEQWRERLIDTGDEALSVFIDGHPDADRNLLRTLTRNARRERHLNKPPKASRQLFRELRKLIENT
jgi:ribosome-associated protein